MADAAIGGSRREVRRAFAVAAVCAVAQGIFVVLFVPFVARALHGDAGETGLLRGVQAIGAIAAGLLLGLTPTSTQRQQSSNSTAAEPEHSADTTPAHAPDAKADAGQQANTEPGRRPDTEADTPQPDVTAGPGGLDGRSLPARRGGLVGRGRRSRAGVFTAVGAGVFGLLDLAIWNAPAVSEAELLFVALFIVAGAPGTVLVTGLISTLQQAAPVDGRGRVFGLFGMVYAGGQAVGELGAGLLGDRVGVVPMLNAQAALYLVGAGVAAVGLGRRPRWRGVTARRVVRSGAGCRSAPPAPADRRAVRRPHRTGCR